MPARHTKLLSYYYFNHVAMLQKIAGNLVWALFVDADDERLSGLV